MVLGLFSDFFSLFFDFQDSSCFAKVIVSGNFRGRECNISTVLGGGDIFRRGIQEESLRLVVFD